MVLGDVMVLLKALGGAERVISADGILENFCKVSGFRTKAILEARKLRVQLTNEVNIRLPGLNLMIDPNMQPPTDAQVSSFACISVTQASRRSINVFFSGENK